MEQTSQKLDAVANTPVNLVEDVVERPLNEKGNTKANHDTAQNAQMDNGHLETVHEAQQIERTESLVTTDIDHTQKMKNQITEYMRQHGSEFGHIVTAEEIVYIRRGGAQTPEDAVVMVGNDSILQPGNGDGTDSEL
jgi:hypothetical protein